ncbi:MAG: alpha/beta hydrolase [Gammaproteobacteria bacterium]|nr:MAG: alpha/beta hydrolase [Gammaproteobacteria bacterium]
MPAEELPAVRILPEGARASVIWFHGLGADGHDFEPLVPELGLSGVRFIFPHAPMRPVTINGGFVMRAWYDIFSPDLRQADIEGLEASRRIAEAFLEEEEKAGIAPRRIVLAGFSQGGALALYTGLRLSEPLAGLMALSAYLPGEDPPPGPRRAIFMAHGTEDPIVPYPLALESRQRLERLGHAVEWHAYPMGHSLCREEIGDIASWLRRVLS